jgi:hypothetical protein
MPNAKYRPQMVFCKGNTRKEESSTGKNDPLVTNYLRIGKHIGQSLIKNASAGLNIITPLFLLLAEAGPGK